MNGSENVSTAQQQFNNPDIPISEWFQRAEAGDPEAQCHLGICYYNGENGIEKDLEKAVRWFDCAARKGYA